MPVTPGHFTLSPEQRHFKQLLDDFQSLTLFGGFDARDCQLIVDRLANPVFP